MKITKINNNYYFKDHDGETFKSIGCNSVSPGGSVDYITKRNIFKETYDKKFKSDSDWIEYINSFMDETKLNTYGAWCKGNLGYFKYSTPIIYTSKNNGGTDNDYTKKEWRDYAEQQIMEQLAKDKDKKILGYFIGNEMWWGRDWRKFSNQTKEQTEAFFETTNSILKNCSNTLNLGVRFVSACTPRYVLKIAGKYCDVISVNFYKLRMGLEYIFPVILGHTMTLNCLKRFYQISGKPILISEFGFRAITENTPSTIKRIYPRYKNQKQRAEQLRNFIRMTNKPWIVGFHHFAYVDQPAGGRSNPADGENNNFGLIDVYLKEYYKYTDVFKEML